MKPALIAILSVLSLAACQRKAEGPPPPPPIGAPPPAPPQPASPPPASFIGRWAATAELCATGAWVFEADRVSTAGEVGCTFKTVTTVGSSYRIDAMCTAQAPAQPQTFTLTMLPANPPAMTVMGGPWSAPVTLHLCAG